MIAAASSADSTEVEAELPEYRKAVAETGEERSIR